MSVRSEPAPDVEGGNSKHQEAPQVRFTPAGWWAGEDLSSFEKEGYVVARGVFDRPTLEIYSTYALMLRADRGFTRREEREGFHDRYGDTLMESILLHLRPSMERATGLSLLPTYSYLRIYEKGSALARHTDRPACEISASLTIGYEAPELWPLWLESGGRKRAVELRPGDMLLYRGREVPHWRERFGGEYWIQAFFHYVDADGPLSSYKFDGRPAVGALPR